MILISLKIHSSTPSVFIKNIYYAFKYHIKVHTINPPKQLYECEEVLQLDNLKYQFNDVIDILHAIVSKITCDTDISHSARILVHEIYIETPISFFEFPK